MNKTQKPRKQVKIYKDYDFNSLEEYYNYIIDSLINGNFSQVKNLYNKLNKENKKEFYSYCYNNDLMNTHYKIIQYCD